MASFVRWHLRRVVACVSACALLASAAGCGKSDFRTVVIVEPAHAIHDGYECHRHPHARYCRFDLRRLLGKQARVAERLVEGTGLDVRVVERDQKGLDITEDFDAGRIDVATESGIVTEIRGIG